MSDTDSTPPIWPIYGVKLSESQISNITSLVFPTSTLTSQAELPKRGSFNNRIYFLNLAHPSSTTPDEPEHFPTESVLKVCGRFFDGRKIQNEVASLLLLAKYCPEVPTPRVVAWSENGKSIKTVRNGVFAVLFDPGIDDHTSSDSSDSHCPHPWLMTSKLPGRTLQKSELEDVANPVVQDLASQLVDVLASMRTNIPHRSELGNITLSTAGHTSTNALHGLDLAVSGILLTATQPDESIKTTTALYSHLLLDQISLVNTKPVFTPIRDRPGLFDRLENFRTSILPDDSFAASSPFSPIDADNCIGMFTHQDFSPRNILVSPSLSNPSALQLTGVLDFEFSGFFPPLEEFITLGARQNDDWPSPFFDLILSKLRDCGLECPGSIDKDKRKEDVAFDHGCRVADLVQHVAPWWLHDAGNDAALGEEGLAKDIERAIATVEGLLGWFEISANKEIV